MAKLISESSEDKPKAKPTAVLKKYCGIKPVPKGYVLGDIEYCLKSNQVRYYGLVKIEANLITELNSKELLPKEREKLRIMEIKLKGLDKKRQDTIKIAKIHNKISKDEKNTDKERKVAAKEYAKLKVDFEKIIAGIEKLQNQIIIQRAHVHTMLEQRDAKAKAAINDAKPKKQSKNKPKQDVEDSSEEVPKDRKKKSKKSTK
jgi:hypothetical protein